MERENLPVTICLFLPPAQLDRKSTRLNSSHGYISYAVFCLKKKKKHHSNVPKLLHRSEPVQGRRKRRGGVPRPGVYTVFPLVPLPVAHGLPHHLAPHALSRL